MDAVMAGVEAAARGELSAPPLSQEAFEALFEAHRDAVFRLACALTDNARDAEDLFQETWLRAVRARPAGPQPGGARAWLATIAANAHRDGLRRKRVRRLFFLERARTMADAAADADPGWDAGRYAGGDVGARADLRLCLRRALAALPPRQRRVFVLKDVEGYKHEEIGRMLGLPEATVRTLLHRATKRLQKDLAAFGPAGTRAPKENEP
ncbi:MAG TPA: RNA polymerase sigma factor [Terriglobales bacterium]|nr:RNA polymerase sigma factor [Terriglobales bacterium]